jgi:hypothetical protein
MIARTENRPDAAGADILQFPCSRALPPTSMSPAQREQWVAILASLPIDWLTPDRGFLLAAYCRSIVSADFLAKIMEQRGPGARRENRHVYAATEKVAQKHLLFMISLAGKLGFTQQKAMRAEAAAVRTKRGSKAERKPWDEGDD